MRLEELEGGPFCRRLVDVSLLFVVTIVMVVSVDRGGIRHLGVA